MNGFIRDIFPKQFVHNPAHWRGFTLALVYIFLAVTQLFRFENYPAIVAGYGFPGGLVVASILAGLIPALEIASLPFLLSMRVHERIWRIGRIATVAVGALWLAIALWLSVTGSTGESGIFGATLPLPSAIWMILFTVLLLFAAILLVREMPRRH